MTTVDQLLLRIINQTPDQLMSVPPRDVKVLKSLAKIVSTPSFITENQSRLLTKILFDNCDKFGELTGEILPVLNAPLWSLPFRPIDKTKKIHIGHDDQLIIIEFAFSSPLRKVMNNMNKKVTGLVQQLAGKQYQADLTEQNIVTLVEELEPLGFEIDQKITDFYKIIKSWSVDDYKSQYLLTSIVHPSFQRHITADLGINTAIDENIINDRSIRYQYFLENPRKNPENLTEKLANRIVSKVWVDKKSVQLEEIIASLLQLRRLPVLIIFDSNDAKKCVEDLANLNHSLEENGIYDGVGIYFRLPSDEQGTKFNTFIADKGYNAQLDPNTRVVGVQNGKIPKFFLKNDWKPMSVITIGGSLKQTKTAVYANYCDLIVTYTDSQPIIENRFIWE